MIRSALLAVIVPGVIAAQVPQAPRITPIDLPVGRSLPITMPVNVTRVAITTPEIADVIVISEREIVINSIKPGETDAILWFADSTRTHYRISVHSPADRKQIAISIKFAEVRRDALRELGVSGLWRDANTRVGTGIFRTDENIDPTTGTVTIPGAGRFLTILSNLGTERVLAFLETEESRGKAKLLAEPTLLAGNNETATFLAGGEIPIPAVQGSGTGGAAGGIGISYRAFGIQLTFTGEILSDSLIKLTVAPEVSSLDFANALQVAGFRIPAFATRRMSSTLDVRRDQSLIISGMFTGEESNVRAGVPFLKDVPILGLLFSSSRYQRSESELLVIVTPMIVDPHRVGSRALELRPDSATPALDAIEPRLRRPPPPNR
jgi:pilus assembly protein CpaC